MSDSQLEDFAFRLDQDMAVDDFPMDMNDPQVREDFEQLNPDEQGRVKNLLDGILAMKGTSEYNARHGEQNAMSAIGDFSADESPMELGIPTGSGARGNIDERIENEEVRDTRLNRHIGKTAPEEDSNTIGDRIQDGIQNIGSQVSDAGEDIMNSGLVNGVRNFVKNSWGTPNFEEDAFPAYVKRYDRLPKNRREWQLARQMERGDIALDQEKEMATHEGEIDRQNTEHEIDYEYQSMEENRDLILSMNESKLALASRYANRYGFNSVSIDGVSVGSTEELTPAQQDQQEEAYAIERNRMVSEAVEAAAEAEQSSFFQSQFGVSETQATMMGGSDTEVQEVVSSINLDYQNAAASAHQIIDQGRFLNPDDPFTEDGEFNIVEYSEDEKNRLRSYVDQLAAAASAGDSAAAGEFINFFGSIYNSSEGFASGVDSRVEGLDEGLEERLHERQFQRRLPEMQDSDMIRRAEQSMIAPPEQEFSIPQDFMDDNRLREHLEGSINLDEYEEGDGLSRFQLGLSEMLQNLESDAAGQNLEPYRTVQSNNRGGTRTEIWNLEDVAGDINNRRRDDEDLQDYLDALQHFMGQIEGAR